MQRLYLATVCPQSPGACKPLGRVSAKLFIEFSRKAFQRDDKEFPIFRLRHAAGTEQIDHEFRDQQHILRAYATHTVRPTSRGSEKGEKLWREYNMRLCKIFTMTKFADRTTD